MKRLAASLALLISCLGATSTGAAETTVRWITIPVELKRVVSQEPLETACGCAAILNCLTFGTPAEQNAVSLMSGMTNAEHLQYLIDNFGKVKSGFYPEGDRWRPDGICSGDLKDMYNDFRRQAGLEPLKGMFLDRIPQETDKAFLERVHGLILNSLLQGEPPILHARSEVARWHQEKNAYLWDGLYSHFITVIGVPEFVNPDGSFVVDFLDPQDGGQQEMLVFVDVRNFLAPKSSGAKSEWLSDRPFLSAACGKLYLKTQKELFWARSEIYLHYGIFK